MDDQASATKAPEQLHQASPLMKLPTELLVKIYEFAFEHTMDKIATDKDQLHPATWQPEGYKLTPFYSGVFALPHTSRTLRAESLDTLSTLARARVGQVVAESASRHNSAAQRLSAANAEGFNAFALALAESFEEAMKLNKSIRRLEYICGVMGWTKDGQRGQ